VLSTLLQGRHQDGWPMNDVEIRDELMTLLLAGHETTATALAWAVERLVRHPNHQARLTEEIHAGEHEFCDAVVKETLRLRPVFSVVGRRLKAPMQIGGVPLPAGVTVVPSIYLMHRRADLYPDAGRFRPERFLEQRAGTYTWIPFGGGVRRCLGAAFAEYEMRIVLAHCLIAARCGPPTSDPNRCAGAQSPTPPGAEPRWCWDETERDAGADRAAPRPHGANPPIRDEI